MREHEWSEAEELVRAWHTAVNTGDADAMSSLLIPDVAVGGPRGSGQGANLVRDWVGGTGIIMEPRRAWHRGDAVVVEQHARWPDATTGEPGASHTVFTAFQVRAGRISRILRFDTLADALQVSGLSADDLDLPWPG